MKPNFKNRSAEIEMLDDLTVAGNDLHQNLRELEVINTYLGGKQVLIEGIQMLAGEEKHLKITDLGCGGGDLPEYIYKALAKKGGTTEIHGIDANPAVIDYARERTKKYTSITYSQADILRSDWNPQVSDIFTLSLFCHHFSDEELVNILQKCTASATKGVVINDLHRHPLAYYSIHYLTTAFSKSTMVKNDAKLSVLRGFKKQEIRDILQKAGITKYQLHWRWPFRFLVVIYV